MPKLARLLPPEPKPRALEAVTTALGLVGCLALVIVFVVGTLGGFVFAVREFWR
jgi:hypothetical protein